MHSYTALSIPIDAIERRFCYLWVYDFISYKYSLYILLPRCCFLLRFCCRSSITFSLPQVGVFFMRICIYYYITIVFWSNIQYAQYLVQYLHILPKIQTIYSVKARKAIIFAASYTIMGAEYLTRNCF